MYSIVYSDKEELCTQELFCCSLEISVEVAKYIFSNGEMASVFNTDSPSDKPLVSF